MQRPATRYARTGEARIAYQVVGEGPVDLIVVGGPASHLDMEWEHPAVVAGIERTASFCRLVRFDRRGTGLSDPVDDPPGAPWRHQRPHVGIREGRRAFAPPRAGSRDRRLDPRWPPGGSAGY